MNASIWPATLESFCNEVAGPNPAPAAVTASALTANLGLALLIKVLEIAGRRKSFAGDTAKLRELIDTARLQSVQVKSAADEDISAVRQYLGSRDPAAVRNAIEVPLRAARAAASGIGLCVEAAGLAGLAEGLPAADLGAAALLLHAALRAILLSVDFNLRRLRSDDPYRIDADGERKELQQRAQEGADAVMRAVRL